MEEYILIAWLNDFIFCPVSIYFHNLYLDTHARVYRGTPETKGLASHKSIDLGTYSGSKHILLNEYVCSEHYKIYGKIDMYNIKTKELVERKTKVAIIYDGYVFQLYAQYFGLKEMGFEVDKLFIYSFEDNKKYNIKKPEEDIEMFKKFENIVDNIRNFNMRNYQPDNLKKCQRCTYANICDRSLYDI